MTRVDLDAIEWALKLLQQESTMLRPQDVADLLALIAEVRAAREVAAAADLFWAQHAYEHDDAASDRLAYALTAYEAVGS